MKVFLVLFVLGLYSSSLIYESIPKNSYKELIKKEIISIQEMNSMQSFAFPNDSEDIQEKGTITIEKVKPFFTIINPDMMDYASSDTEVKFSFKKKENDISCLIMSFDCEYSNVAGFKSTATFSIIAKDYSFTKTYKQFEESNFFIANAQAEITFEISNVSVKNAQIISNEEFAVLLKKYLDKIEINLVKAYNEKGISSYYIRGILNKEIKDIYVNKGTVIGENTITLTLDKEPLIKEKSVINHYNGNINDLIEAEDPLDIDLPNYFIAVNKKILQSLINENLFSYKMEESQKPIKDYSLSIASVSEICAELKDLKEQALKTTQEIKSVTIDFNNFPAGQAIIQIDLISTENEEVLLSFNTELAIKFEMTLFQRGINFRLKSNDIGITAITVNPQPLRTITNETLLRKWILDSFKVYLLTSEYNLFNLSFDLNDSFSNFRSIKIEKNYFLIE